MALVMIYNVLSHCDFVTKLMVKNLNKDFIHKYRTGGGSHSFVKLFHKITLLVK